MNQQTGRNGNQSDPPDRLGEALRALEHMHPLPEGAAQPPGGKPLILIAAVMVAQAIDRLTEAIKGVDAAAVLPATRWYAPEHAP